MRAVLRVTVLAAALPLLAGCGGSSHPAASRAATVTATSPITSPLPTVSTSVSSSAAASTTTRHRSQAGSVTPGSGGVAIPSAPGGTGGVSTGSGSAGGGAIDARVPAIFTLAATGTLSPSQVSAPAFLAVALRINSASGSGHSVTIATPHAVQLRISAHGSATTTLRGLRAGTYPILVDGVRRGALAIGGEPGP